MSKAVSAVAAASLVRAGDTVLFKSLHAEEMGNGADEVPAIVTRVWTPTCVNLQVLRDANTPHAVTSIVYDADAKGTQRSWRFRDDAARPASEDPPQAAELGLAEDPPQAAELGLADAEENASAADTASKAA
jgi:hypothetical protein